MDREWSHAEVVELVAQLMERFKRRELSSLDYKERFWQILEENHMSYEEYLAEIRRSWFRSAKMDQGWSNDEINEMWDRLACEGLSLAEYRQRMIALLRAAGIDSEQKLAALLETPSLQPAWQKILKEVLDG